MVQPANTRQEAGKIVAIYAFFGCSWIFFSDSLLGWLIHDPAAMAQVGIAKGIAFIACTALLLFFLINRLLDRNRKSLMALAESEERFRLLVKNSSDCLIILDRDGRQRYISPGAERITGYPVNELLDRPLQDLIHPDDMDAVTAAWLETLAHPEKTVTVQYRHVHKTNAWVYSEAIAQSFMNEPAITGVIASVRDITSQKRDEGLLRESEDKFRLAFSSSPDAININRLEDGMYVDVNEGFCRTLGYSPAEVIGRTSLELNIWSEPKGRQRLVERLSQDGVCENLEAEFRTKDGRLLTGLMSARIIPLKGALHIISITRDITERKIHQKEQLKIEKLESLGILAGGIAHDFNNILTGIMGNISFARVFLDPSHSAYRPLAAAEKAAMRAGELAHQLLTFARGGEPIKKIVSAPQVIDEALGFVLHGSNVRAEVDISDSVSAFEADEGQISQVLHNIFINATQAMPGGGILKVGATDIDLVAGNPAQLPPSRYVRITIADQGCGITTDNLKKIFDPYFSTKSEGYGLGLASVYSIIARHGGHVAVSSELGQGTCFTIFLPATNGQATPTPAAGDNLPADSPKKGGAILVMDDDSLITEIATAILTHAGYTATICRSGEEAIDRYTAAAEAGSPFAMVIMDLTIPGRMGGQEAAAQIKARFPAACLVVSSGYSNDQVMSHYQDYGFDGAIAKPYTMEKFKRVLDGLLALPLR